MHYIIRTVFFTCLLLYCSASFAAPTRIVSANLCADQLLLQLADKNQIRAITSLSKDPALSYFIDKTQGLDVIRGTLESILPMQPDLVLLGTDKMSDASEAALESLGIHVLRVGMPNTIKEVEKQIHEVADAIGKRDRAKSLISKMQSQLIQSRLIVQKFDYAPRIAFMYNGGYAEGRGGLLQNMLNIIGLENLIKNQQDANLSLESLITETPDMIVQSEAASQNNPSLDSVRMNHPAMKKLDPLTFLYLPPAMMICGNNAIAEVAKNITNHLLEIQPPATQVGFAP